MSKQSRSKKQPTARAGRKSPFPLNARIAVLVEGNPRRKGTRGERIFSLYKRVRTVADFYERGADIKAGAHDLRWDKDRKFIAIRAH